MITENKQVGLRGGVPATHEALAATPKVVGGGSGGDGQVTATNDGGGRILGNTRIVLIYWGSAWALPATNPSQAEFTNALSGIISGPWGTQLVQYRGSGSSLWLEQVDLNTTSDPPVSFTDPDIQAMIDTRITNGNVPAPSNAIDRIYCVLMPTGHSSGDTKFVGQHQFYDHNGARVYWAWVTNDGTLTGGNSIPKVFTHEVAEACSDPDLGSGIILTSSEGDEIGDVCNNTFSTVNGAAEEAYWSAVDNRCVLPTSQPFPIVTGDPALIQSRFGSKGNFEMVVPAAQGGLIHFWRNNDNPRFPWSGPIIFGQNLGVVNAVTLIESNFGSPGNLEVVAQVGSQLYAFWRDSGPAFNWNGPFLIEGGVAGNPVLIQSRFGSQGNFEMVAPAAQGGLVHFWRNNDNPQFPWSGPIPFGQNLRIVNAVTLIESNFGSPGNLEVVARVGSQLYAFWRDSGPAFNWNGSILIEGGVAGNPVLIQSRFGSQGNFEMVAPAAQGGLIHFWRNNDNPQFPWSGPIPFGQSLGMVDTVTLIESNFGSPGNLEVVARVGGQLYAFWRDSGPAFNWNGPTRLTSTVW